MTYVNQNNIEDARLWAGNVAISISALLLFRKTRLLIAVTDHIGGIHAAHFSGFSQLHAGTEISRGT